MLQDLIWGIIADQKQKIKDEPATSDGDNHATAACRQRAGLPCQAVEDGGQP